MSLVDVLDYVGMGIFSFSIGWSLVDTWMSDVL